MLELAGFKAVSSEVEAASPEEATTGPSIDPLWM
jgi:hypothetical protein